MLPPRPAAPVHSVQHVPKCAVREEHVDLRGLLQARLHCGFVDVGGCAGRRRRVRGHLLAMVFSADRCVERSHALSVELGDRAQVARTAAGHARVVAGALKALEHGVVPVDDHDALSAGRNAIVTGGCCRRGLARSESVCYSDSGDTADGWLTERQRRGEGAEHEASHTCKWCSLRVSLGPYAALDVLDSPICQTLRHLVLDRNEDWILWTVGFNGSDRVPQLACETGR